MGTTGSEIEALLRAWLRLRLDPGGRDRVGAALREGAAEWPTLRAVIRAERIGPLLHRTVGPLLPPPAATELKHVYRKSGVRNLRLRRQLRTCLEALAAARVPALVLKGAALIDTVYGHVALRPIGDVDVLVRRSDVAAARQVLEELGYQPRRPETNPGALVEYENEMPFCQPGWRDTWFDLHWTLFDSPFHQERVAMDWFWDSARPAMIAETPSLVLGPEALLIHLCGHLALHHASTGLLWWQDVAEVLARYRDTIDWQVLMARAAQFGLVLPVQRVLSRVADDWGAPIPADALAALRAMRASPAEQRIVAELGAPRRSARRRFWTDLRSMMDWHQRWRFARTTLFPSPAYMRRRYGIARTVWLPLLYPYRWLRGVLDLR